MKPYPSYKESGVEWLGEIPKHWAIHQLSVHSKVQNGFAFKSEHFDPLEGTPIIRIRDITSGKVETFYKGDFDDSFLVENEDILIGMDGDFLVRWWQGGEALLNQRCARLLPIDTISERYLYFCLQFPLTIINDLTYFTTVKHLSSEQIRKILLSIPPLPEQQAIAKFLDDKTQKIDRVISIKEKQIEHLNELRTTIINQAVTKGLDPNVPMKDSGIEWLGEIPKHWEVNKVKYLCSFLSGGTPSTDKREYWVGGVPWVSAKDMKADLIVKTEDTVSEKALADNQTKELPVGSILLVVRSGILRHTIPIAITGVRLTFNQDIKGILPNEMLSPSFFKYFVRGLQHVLLLEWGKQGATVESLEFEYITQTRFPLPTVDEQQSIADYLDQKTAKIDHSIQVNQKQINQLKEYRTSLISEVVTGKVDVREAV